MPRVLETHITFDYDAQQSFDNDCLGIYCFTDREISILVSCLRPALWPSRWYGSNGKLLRDDNRQGDLETGLQAAEFIMQKLLEC